MENTSSLLLAFLGISMVSSGSVLQKMGSSWLGWKEEKNWSLLKNFMIWSAGFCLYNLSVVPIGMASKILPPYIISSISGFGISLILLLSFLLLKEKMYFSDIVYSFIIVAAVLILSLIQQPNTIVKMNKIALYTLLLLPFIFVIPVFFNRVTNKIKTIIFSLLSGSTGGLNLVMVNITVKENGFYFYDYIHSPYFYLWIGMGAVSLLALQFAIMYGEIIQIGPLQQSSTIIYPVLCSYFMFGTSLFLTQIIAIMVIVFACVAMLKKRSTI